MKKIKCDLSLSGSRSIQNAIREVELYTLDFVAKVDLFIRRLGAVGIVAVKERSGSHNFPTSFVINQVGNGYISGTLTVNGGEELLFFEFGTGITYNEYPSSHPKGAKLGMIIGEYGKGLGKNEYWFYQGEKHYGDPARMPVYRAYLELLDQFRRIAKEVWYE